MLKNFTIPGNPIPQARPRVFSRGGKIIAYNPNAAQKKAIQYKIPTDILFVDPVRVTIRYFMPIPASTTKKNRLDIERHPHTKKPDLDNLCKFTIDLLIGTCIKDDSLIFFLMASKQYSSNPRTEIEIYSD